MAGEGRVCLTLRGGVAGEGRVWLMLRGRVWLMLRGGVAREGRVWLWGGRGGEIPGLPPCMKHCTCMKNHRAYFVCYGMASD